MSTNTVTWAYSEDFYYVWATGLWPTYAAVAACVLCWLANRIRLRKGSRTLAFLVLFLAIFGTHFIDQIFGWFDGGRTGLDRHAQSLGGGFNTTRLSTVLIAPALLVGWIGTQTVWHRKCSGNLNETIDKDEESV